MTVRTRLVTYTSTGEPDPTDWHEFDSREEAEQFNAEFLDEASVLTDLLVALGSKAPTVEYEEVEA